jgi:hypothetical protein
MLLIFYNLKAQALSKAMPRRTSILWEQNIVPEIMSILQASL